MYPKTVNGTEYCCKTIRVDGFFGYRYSTKSYGRCKANPRNVKCKSCFLREDKPFGFKYKAMRKRAKIKPETRENKPKTSIKQDIYRVFKGFLRVK